MSKLKMHTPEFAKVNIDHIAEFFLTASPKRKTRMETSSEPSTFDQLRQELSTKSWMDRVNAITLTGQGNAKHCFWQMHRLRRLFDRVAKRA